MRGIEPVERRRELGRAQPVGGLDVRAGGLRVLDQVAVEALAVADGRLEADGVLHELEQLLDALGREARLVGDLVGGRVAVELLREDAAAAHDAAHLLGDVHGQADRPALLGERPGDRLADPPRRVRRELEAHRVVELLDRADQAEVALLDQVEQRHAGLRVVARDRHHEPEVRLDQLALGRLVALVLAPCELALLGGGQQAAVADLAHVELERILRRLGDDRDGSSASSSSSASAQPLLASASGSGASTRLEAGQELEMRLGRLGDGVEDGLGGVWLHLASVSASGGKGLRNPLKPVENDLQLKL